MISVCIALANPCFAQAFAATSPSDKTRPITAVADIEKGERPPRPAHLGVTEELWKLIKRCWDKDPRSRPEALEVLQIILLGSSVSHSFRLTSIRELDCALISSTTWKRLIDHTLPTNERIQLIITIFSDRDEVEMFKYLSGDNAQAFVDAIHEASTASCYH